MKKIYSTILVGNLLLVLSFFSCQAPEMRVFDLRTDYLTNPVAIQANFIWLGWKLDVCNGKNRNKMQSAYQILVASDSLLLFDDIGDLWDSGKVNSSQSQQILYKGRALVSRQHVYWEMMA